MVRMADADPRLDPANAHPLNAFDCLRSQARIADIQLGLTSPADCGYWRAKAEARIAALEDDGAWFGHAPHEEAELEQLKGLLANVNAKLAPARPVGLDGAANKGARNGDA
jgi:hypothetical protein